ncbi:hypothetical protein CERSUDRAFT_77616 [Gelatoporia subvermispora B]|uniref:Uncharacterized protein n=1 Tax=Ceriporiopsis subvermispora (strain B) TaxID=914234 RepID=M2QZL9_CERS8|nr:hypothetical protein CERSUDRAFT_77616 [Gelatoporia subvermispora B]
MSDVVGVTALTIAVAIETPKTGTERVLIPPTYRTHAMSDVVGVTALTIAVAIETPRTGTESGESRGTCNQEEVKRTWGVIMVLSQKPFAVKVVDERHGACKSSPTETEPSLESPEWSPMTRKAQRAADSRRDAGRPRYALIKRQQLEGSATSLPGDDALALSFASVLDSRDLWWDVTTLGYFLYASLQHVSFLDTPEIDSYGASVRPR